ncbi:MAG: DEAD/DEAH box helicase [Candidatus Woesearchaeota archaeon]
MSLIKEVPQYLQAPEQQDYLYGKLTYNKSWKAWVIEGDPSAVEMAKRLFPGSKGMGYGTAKFPANKRNTANLNWFLMRFPLEIKDREKWEESRKEAVEHAIKRNEILKKPKKISPPMEFQGELLDYQKEGLSFLLHNERTLLADEMGLGKTVTGLAWLSSLQAYPALIIVPPHLIKQWVSEIRKFLNYTAEDKNNIFNQDQGRVHVLTGLTPYELPPANIYITHYLLLRGWKKILPYFGFKGLIFDEIQSLRHSGTEKYSSASLIAENVENVCGLSGTPIYNEGGEIWNVLNILEYHCLGDWDSFTREWCYGYGNKRVRQPKVLGDFLKREGLLLRRTKKDVLSELPPKRRFIQEIDVDEGLYGSMIGKAVDLAVRSEKTEDNFESGRLTREAINETRRVTGIAKAKYVCDFVKGLLDAGEKVILYAYHHDVWDIYHKYLDDYRPAKITGKQNSNEKDEAQRNFMDGKTNLIFISLRSASGLNLQQGNVVVFGELDWSPAIHTQAEDRAHRIGQKDSVLCYYLVCEEGTDQDMIEALGFKVQQFTGIMGDKTESQEDRMLAQQAAKEHMQKIVAKLKAKKIS